MICSKIVSDYGPYYVEELLNTETYDKSYLVFYRAKEKIYSTLDEAEKHIQSKILLDWQKLKQNPLECINMFEDAEIRKYALTHIGFNCLVWFLAKSLWFQELFGFEDGKARMLELLIKLENL